MSSHAVPRSILIAGANGTVGRRLLPFLWERGYQVRLLVRDPKRLKIDPRQAQVEVCQSDVLKPESLAGVLDGVDAAYYLIHSMQAGEGFVERDKQAAKNFGIAARAAGVKRILYLGGLGDPETDLSVHLRSRQETADILRQSGIPVTEFRAGIIVGAGSLSFEMIRNLTERIPLMICPRWVFQHTQPIAIDDVLNYLVTALEVPASAGRIVQIGGNEVLTYGDLMRGYAQARGLRRFLIPVPVLTPRLSSYWVHWTTPLPASMARPLIEGLKSEVVVKDDSAEELFPAIDCMDYAQAVKQALSDLHPGSFSGCVHQDTDVPLSAEPVTHNWLERGMILETWQIKVNAAPPAVYRAFANLGGERGWRPLHSLWALRAACDRLIGGIGMRKGRPPLDELAQGNTIDFYRVGHVTPDHCLHLEVELKLPGQGWLHFETCPADGGGTHLRLIVFFAPRGLPGILYWYGLLPLHRLIFRSLIRSLKKEAEGERIGMVE